MKNFRLVLLIVFLVALSSTVVSADPKRDRSYRDSASGSFFTSVIDSNGDGIPGVIGDLEGHSVFGSVNIHFFSEFDVLAAAPSESCPEGYLEAPVVTSRTIHSYRNGDLLYLETKSEVFCGDPTSGAFEWHETLQVIGGTGRFSSAEGEIEVSGSGNLLITGVEGLTNFGGLSLKGKGKIRLNAD